MTFQEVQRLLHLMNVEMNQEYALSLFEVSHLGQDLQRPARHIFS